MSKQKDYLVSLVALQLEAILSIYSPVACKPRLIQPANHPGNSMGVELVHAGYVEIETLCEGIEVSNCWRLR